VCKDCGCGLPGDVAIDGVRVGSEAAHSGGALAHGHDHEHEHTHGHDHAHAHGHDHEHPHPHPHEHHRTLTVEQGILDKNDRLAERNRGYFQAKQLFVLNVLASPGAGKTALIERTASDLGKDLRLGVIVGDLATDNDAQRLRESGAPVVQITTGTVCHLEAEMVARAVKQLDLSGLNLLIIENVGNLVCPAAFQLGSHLNLLIASIPEGDDKPYKYPGMYRGVQALVINKTDLLPYVPFKMDYFRRGVEALNPGLATFLLSCRTGEGLPAFADWLVGQVQHGRKKNPR